MKQGLFNFCYSKYLISRIKIFTSDGINQSCENKGVLVKMDYPPKGKFLYPFPSPFPLPKTEKEKGFQKEKRQKIKEKNRKNFLQIFPVDPLPLFHKKEFKRK